MKILVAAIGGLAVLSAAAPAHADTNQVAYVRELQAAGIPGTSDQQLPNGYLLCQLLSDQDVIVAANMAAPHLGLSVGDAAFQIGAAIRWLCPQQTWQINELRGGADPRVPGVSSAITGYLG